MRETNDTGDEDRGRADERRADEGRGGDERLRPGSHEWNLQQRGETPMQRADRNYIELLAELRVLQAGVQILFGFLLILAVQPRFTSITGFGRVTFVITLITCATSTALFMAPVAYHRAKFSKGVKPVVVATSNRLAKIGMFFLLLSMVGSALLVLDFTLNRELALIITGVLALVFAGLWYVLPALAAPDRR